MATAVRSPAIDFELGKAPGVGARERLPIHVGMLREIHHAGERDFHPRSGREPDRHGDGGPAFEGGFRGLTGGKAALAIREQIRLVGGRPERELAYPPRPREASARRWPCDLPNACYP